VVYVYVYTTHTRMVVMQPLGGGDDGGGGGGGGGGLVPCKS
jgi:hypothetical protein